MSSSVSRESGQRATAAAPVVDLTVPEPVNPTIPDVAAAGDAVPAAAAIDLSAPDQGKKRKVDDSASADEDAIASSSSPRAAKRAKVGEPEQRAVPESIFGGDAGPRQPMSSRAPGPFTGMYASENLTTDDDDEVIFVSSHPLKRGRQDDHEEEGKDDEDEVVFLRAAKRARSTSPSAVDACTIDHARGVKRSRADQEDEDDDVILVSVNPVGVKRPRTDGNDTTSPVEAADEEVERPDLPLSAADVVRSAASSAGNITESGHVINGAATEDAPATKEKTSFMSMPIELREMVYHYALVAPKAVAPRVPQLRAQAYRVGFPIGRVCSLLLANKQISREALHFLFRENVFSLTLKYHRSWLNTIGRHHSSCLRRIIVECDGKNKHAVDNLVAFQNTLAKRTRGDQLRELTYKIHWTMGAQAALRSFDRPEFRKVGWQKTWKRLEGVTVDILDRFSNNAQRLVTEETQRTLSRLALDSGVPVHGRLLRKWRRDKKSLPWCRVTLKDGWEKLCTKDHRGQEGKWVPLSQDKWRDIVKIEVLRPTF